MNTVCSALHRLGSKDGGDTLRTRAVGQDAKAGGAVRAHKTKGRFNWACLGHVLLAADDCTCFGHPLQACLGAFHSTMPGFGAVLAACWQEAQPERRMRRQGGLLCTIPVCLWILWSASAAASSGGRSQKVARRMTEEFLEGERTLSYAETRWFMVISGENGTRLRPGAPSGTCVRVSCSAAQHQPYTPTASMAAGEDQSHQWGGKPGALSPRSNPSGIASTQGA